ncbi:hypothetical protein GBAR_LOCUS16887 [Geodia barretti]|uniref:Uncharacterized protein n=1 Tax=Geodia barretti TaxID=519541 RepID=A0AA35WUW4_GEOBA|nr:hypothetical protein GBAR_LOCUS16887 [Geodia barretti]
MGLTTSITPPFARNVSKFGNALAFRLYFRPSGDRVTRGASFAPPGLMIAEPASSSATTKYPSVGIKSSFAKTTGSPAVPAFGASLPTLMVSLLIPSS